MAETKFKLNPHDTKKYFKDAAAPLYEGAHLEVYKIDLDKNEALKHLLSLARRARHMMGGLEAIELFLQQEEKGLAALRGTQPGQRAARITRILLLANDGSERFYKSVELILKKYGNRVLGIRLESSGTRLGCDYFGQNAEVKAILLKHKVVVENFFKALLPD